VSNLEIGNWKKEKGIGKKRKRKGEGAHLPIRERGTEEGRHTATRRPESKTKAKRRLSAQRSTFGTSGQYMDFRLSFK
jgi:hypothetical protein